jgi:hypothetical protein
LYSLWILLQRLLQMLPASGSRTVLTLKIWQPQLRSHTAALSLAAVDLWWGCLLISQQRQQQRLCKTTAAQQFMLSQQQPAPQSMHRSCHWRTAPQQ